MIEEVEIEGQVDLPLGMIEARIETEEMIEEMIEEIIIKEITIEETTIEEMIETEEIEEMIETEEITIDEIEKTQGVIQEKKILEILVEAQTESIRATIEREVTAEDQENLEIETVITTEKMDRN